MAQKTKRKGKKKTSDHDMFGKVMTAVISVLFLIIVVVAMALMTQQLYRFGYDLFGEQPGTGVEIEVEFEVAEGESAMTTAKRLKDKNLISSELIFIIQKMLYEKEIIAGTHVLNSNMTTLQVLDELSTPTGRANDY
ncbi:MAG: hypothetical protein IJZ85_09125 [Lachnospiraceae bacterium]|nr:hypothetical protein [Lachnospiraceae bacterium]